MPLQTRLLSAGEVLDEQQSRGEASSGPSTACRPTIAGTQACRDRVANLVAGPSLASPCPALGHEDRRVLSWAREVEAAGLGAGHPDARSLGLTRVGWRGHHGAHESLSKLNEFD